MSSVEIIDYKPEHKRRFIEINEAWITKSFEMEEIDREELYHPEKNILVPGGAILLAVRDGLIVGTSALVKMDENTFELIKMVVDEKYRGQKIGRLLCSASLKRARELGAKKVVLHSNTKGSQTAVKLYYELGFKPVPLGKSEFQRADIKMAIHL
jgi:GNAT superfamily N-acetyltransferase